MLSAILSGVVLTILKIKGVVFSLTIRLVLIFRDDFSSGLLTRVN